MFKFSTSISVAAPVGEDSGVAAIHQIDIRIANHVAGDTAADFQIERLLLTLIHQVLTITRGGGKPGRIAGAQNLLAAVADQHHLAAQDDDEFVILGMPMALRRRRPGARRTKFTPNRESPSASPSARRARPLTIFLKGLTQITPKSCYHGKHAEESSKQI